MALRVLLSGATGRMGETLRTLIQADPGLELIGGVDRAEAASESVRPLEQAAELIQRADVVIDFSAPEFTRRLLGEVPGKAILVGTTGLGDEEERLLDARAQDSPVLQAANFSVAVNLLLIFAEQAARVLGPEYDVEIVEAHHRLKEDAPSGTALALAQAVARGRGVDLQAVRRDGRTGRPGLRPENEIALHALRGGTLAGEHQVMLIGDLDRLTLSHQAADRSLFAAGALRAAHWLHGRAAGRYTMRQVLGM